MNRVLTYGEQVDVTDEELTAEALAADPGALLPGDAIPFDAGNGGESMLPAWYMPAPGSRLGKGRRVVFTIVAGSLVACNAVGFCVTFGFPEFVWH